MRKSRGQAPPPIEIEREARALARELARLVYEYRWLHDAVYSPSSGQSAGYISGSRPEDRVGALVSDGAREQARRSMVRARERLLNALSQVQEAEVQLSHGLPGFAPRPSAEPEDASLPTISTTEYRQSREAQDRRRARGEGWGSG